MNGTSHLLVTYKALNLLQAIDPYNLLASDAKSSFECRRWKIAGASLDADLLDDLEMVTVISNIDNPHHMASYSKYGRHFTAFNHYIDIGKGPITTTIRGKTFLDYDGYSYNNGSGSKKDYQKASELIPDTWYSKFVADLADFHNVTVDQGIALAFTNAYIHAPGQSWYINGKCSPAIERYLNAFLGRQGDLVKQDLFEQSARQRFPGLHIFGYSNSSFIPVSWMAEYWANSFKHWRDVTDLGYLLHAIEDAAVPQHAAGRHGNWHQLFEDSLENLLILNYWKASEKEAINNGQYSKKEEMFQWLLDKNPKNQLLSQVADVAADLSRKWWENDKKLLGLPTINDTPGRNWSTSNLVTWLALHAYNVYQTFYNKPSYLFDLTSIGILIKLCLAMCVLVLRQATKRPPIARRESRYHSGFFIQSTFGNKGDFYAAVSPKGNTEFDLLIRSNDDQAMKWSRVRAYGSGVADYVSMIQSSYSSPTPSPGHIEVIVRNGRSLKFYWMESNPPFSWSEVKVDVFRKVEPIANPALIEGDLGKGYPRNFEMVVPIRGGGFVHFSRANDQPIPRWYGPNPTVDFSRELQGIALLQSTFGKYPSTAHLEVVAVDDLGRLVFFWREGEPPYSWHGPLFFGGAGFRGVPCFLQGTLGGKPGNFELVVAVEKGGLAHYSRNNGVSGLPWYGPTYFGTGMIRATSLIQSIYGMFGYLEVLAINDDGTISHYNRSDVDPYTWYGPFKVDV